MGLWSKPGGTVRFGEPLKTTVTRAAVSEVRFNLPTGTFLDYIEYPGHYQSGLDSPVGLAFVCPVEEDHLATAAGECEWFTMPAEPMHTEQRAFLLEHRLMHPRISSMNELNWSTSSTQEVKDVERGAAGTDVRRA